MFRPDLSNGLFSTGVFLALLAGIGVSQAEEARLPFVPVPADQSGLAPPFDFQELGPFGKINWPWMSPPVDIDGDGHLDVIVYGHHGGLGPDGEKSEGGAAAVWLGRGDGTFVFDDRGYHRRWTFGARDPIWIDLTGNGAMDGIVTERARFTPRLMLNDGTGHWQLADLRIPGMLIDTNGDGRFDGIWNKGGIERMDPPLSQWGAKWPEKLTFTEVWNAEESLGWPEAVERGRFGGWREAYSVDLDGDDRNELVLNIQGPGFHTSQLASRVLARNAGPDGEETWIDTTGDRGLPTGIGHCLYPEDVDVDGHLDLVDLETGDWYRNDGRGHFAVSPQRIYAPENRQFKRKRGRPWTPDNELEWIDLTNNGYRDLVTATDHGTHSGVFLNLGGGRFVEVGGVPGNRRDRKFGDLTGDHRLDMFTQEAGEVTLYRNESPYRGLTVRLVPRSENSEASSPEAHLGAKLWVYEAGHLGDPTRLVHYRQGFMGQRAHRSNVISPDLHVGVQDRETVDLRVRFPSGVVQEVRSARAETLLVIRETP